MKKRQRSHTRAIPTNRAPNGTIRAIMAEKQGTFPRERRRRRERRSRRASRSFSQKRRAARLLWTRAYHHGILRAFQRGPPRLPRARGTSENHRSPVSRPHLPGKIRKNFPFELVTKYEKYEKRWRKRRVHFRWNSVVIRECSRGERMFALRRRRWHVARCTAEKLPLTCTLRARNALFTKRVGEISQFTGRERTREASHRWFPAREDARTKRRKK